MFGDAPAGDQDALLTFLANRARDFWANHAKLEAIDDRTKDLGDLKAAARDAAERLDFEEVEALLSRVQEAEVEIGAETAEVRARNALLRGKTEQAFQLFAAAADSFAIVDPLEPARRRILHFFGPLREHGRFFGASGLKLAIRLLDEVLDHGLKAKDPWLWATGMQSMAVALFDLGDRAKNDGTRLEVLLAAEASCRNALSVFSRSEHPKDRAMALNTLSNSLRRRGGEKHGTDCLPLLDKAEFACREANELFGSIKNLEDVAKTDNNLGNILYEKGLRIEGETGSCLIFEALRAYRDASETQFSNQMYVEFAETQFNQAHAEAALTIRDTTSAISDPNVHLFAALAHVEAALVIYDPVHMPYDHGKATRLRDDLRKRLRLSGPA